MNSFLENLTSSIDVIDAQIEFERLLASLPSVEMKPAELESWLAKLKHFGEQHRFSKAQAVTLLGLLKNRSHSESTSEARVLLLEIMVSICEFSRDACMDLFETTDSVDSLLAGLSDADVFIKYQTIRLVRIMNSVRSVALVAALLRHPEHMRSIMTLLSASTSDFVRNESLRLLGDLVSESNPDLSAFLAFQGTTEALLDILIEQTPDMPDTDVASQVISILKDFVRTEKTRRYARETQCLHPRLEPILTMCLKPILDHASGIAAEEGGDDDLEHISRRIHQGWTLASESVKIASLVFPELSPVVFEILQTCGSSPLLDDSARGDCFSFIAHAIEAGAHHTPLIDIPHFGEPNPLLWRVFPILVDESSPLSVRKGIDSIVAATCSQPESQPVLASMMGIGLMGDVEDEFDPRFAYIENSPSRTVTAILVHATENVTCRIPDSTSLASQVWFSLSTIGHICRKNPEILKSLLFVKLSETSEKTLLQTVAELVLNRQRSPGASDKDESASIVSTAAELLLTEFLILSPSELGSFVSNLPDTKFLESIISSASTVSDTSKTSVSSIISLMLLLLLITYGEVSGWRSIADVVGSALGDRIGYSEIFKVLSSWFNLKPRKNVRKNEVLPYMSDQVRTELLSILPDVQRTVLSRCLGATTRRVDGTVSTTVEASKMVEVLSAGNESLKEEVAFLKTQISDWKSNFTGSEKIVEENERLRETIKNLQQEIRRYETDIARIELMRDAENSAMKEIVNEQETQIHALLASYNQLVELSASTTPQKDMNDLLELLQKIYNEWPETRKLMTGPRFVKQRPVMAPSGPLTSPFMRRLVGSDSSPQI